MAKFRAVERMLFQGGRLLDPEAGEAHEGHALLVEGGRITAALPPGQVVEGAEVVDLAGRSLAPGFLDVHFHGALIFDAIDAPAASMRQDAASILRHGVTGFLPTTVALGPDELVTRVEAMAEAADRLREGEGHAGVLGIHLEGPWISPGAPGAQPPAGIRPFEPAEGEAVFAAAGGKLRMVTLAPELPGSEALIKELDRRGVVASMGHTQAAAEQAEAGFERGVRHATHLFNAMGSFHHRAPGAIGAVLAASEVSCDLICDGVHVHPTAVRAAARAKGEGLVLITDRIEPPEEGGLLGEGTLTADGPVWRLPGGTLAGSRLPMAEAVANASRFGAMTRLEAIAAATLRPARLLGVENERGTLRPGARADFVVLAEDGSVAETWLAGRRAYAR